VTHYRRVHAVVACLTEFYELCMISTHFALTGCYAKLGKQF